MHAFSGLESYSDDQVSRNRVTRSANELAQQASETICIVKMIPFYRTAVQIAMAATACKSLASEIPYATDFISISFQLVKMKGVVLVSEKYKIL
jgi:hypothetical protein